MFIYNICTGSKGNATLIFNEQNECIMVDFGISKLRVTQALRELNYSFDDIKALFVTHEHTDHISGLPNFAPEKIYTSFKLNGSHLATYFKTRKNVSSDYILNLMNNSHVIDKDNTYKIGNFTIETISSNHDATNPLSYIIYADNQKLVLITDTGYIQEKVMYKFKDADFIMIESNHDEQMLINSGRPFPLIKRILSSEGHLSNSQCGYYLADLIAEKTKEVMFIHLSQDCNTPDCCFNTNMEILNNQLGYIPQVTYKISSQTEPTTMGIKPEYLKHHE